MKKGGKYFKINESLRGSVSNLNWLFLEKIARMFISLFVGVYIARSLGETTYGLLAYTVGIGTILTSITTIIHRDILIKRLAQEELKEILVVNAIITNFIIVMIVMCGLLLVQFYFDIFGSNPEIIFTYLSILIVKIFLPFEYMFKAQKLSKYVAVSTIVAVYASAIGKILVIHYNGGLNLLVLMYVLEWIIYFSVLYYFLKSYKFILSGRKFDTKSSVDLITESFPLIVSGVFIAIFLHSDIVLLEKLTSFQELGWYSAAVRLSSIWYVVPSVVTVAFMPAMATSKDSITLAQNFKLILMGLLAVSLIATFMTILIADIAVYFLYGESFEPSSKILQIHILSLTAIYLSMHIDQLLVIKCKNNYILRGYVLAAVVNVLLNLILIPFYSSMGAALATTIAYNIKLFYSWAVIKKFKVLSINR